MREPSCICSSSFLFLLVVFLFFFSLNFFFLLYFLLHSLVAWISNIYIERAISLIADIEQKLYGVSLSSLFIPLNDEVAQFQSATET